MRSNKQRKVGALLSYLSIIINTVIQLIYTPFLIKMLGQSEHGVYSLVSSIIGYLTVMDLGFGNAIIVYTTKYRTQKKKKEEQILHGMFNLIFKILGIIAALLGLVLYFTIDDIFGSKMSSDEIRKMKSMMLVLSFNLLLTFSFGIYNSIISAYEEFTFQKIVSILHSILTPLLSIPMLLLGYKSVSLAIIITISNIITVFLNYYYCKKKIRVSTKFNGFNHSLFKMILGYSVWIFLGVIVDKVNYSVDNVILGAVAGTIAVSIYSVATTFNTVFINISTAISSVMLPKMTQLVTEKAPKSILTNEMIKVGRLQNYIIFLAYSGFVLLGKIFIYAWVGEAFHDSYYVTLLLITPACIPLIQNTGLSILQAMNKYRFKSLSTIIMALFNVIISVFFAKIWGPIGAALGTSIALVICNVILMNIYYLRVIKLDILRFWKEIIKQTIPFTIPIITMIVLMKLIRIDGFRGFIIYGIVYVLLYSFIAYFISMNTYEKELIYSFKDRFLKKR